MNEKRFQWLCLRIDCHFVHRQHLQPQWLPLVELLRPIPPLAYLPLLVIWFGIGETTKVLLIFFSILAPVIISSAHGVLSHQLNRERAALSLGASQSQVFWHVILPTALPHIITGIRIGLGVGWSTLVAAFIKLLLLP